MLSLYSSGLQSKEKEAQGNRPPGSWRAASRWAHDLEASKETGLGPQENLSLSSVLHRIVVIVMLFTKNVFILALKGSSVQRMQRKTKPEGEAKESRVLGKPRRKHPDPENPGGRQRGKCLRPEKPSARSLGFGSPPPSFGDHTQGTTPCFRPLVSQTSQEPETNPPSPVVGGCGGSLFILLIFKAKRKKHREIVLSGAGGLRAGGLMTSRRAKKPGLVHKRTFPKAQFSTAL